MESKFNETDSMLVIREMIEQAKDNLKEGDGKYLVLWGYIITIACFAHYISYTILDFGYTLSNYIWTILPIIGVIVTFFFIWNDRKKEVVKTYVSSMISRIWTGFGCTAFLVAFLLAGKNGMYIYPAISLVYAYATFLSAGAFRMKWMYISAAICAVCVILYRFVPYSAYPLLMGTMLICGNLIPGHIINYKAKKNV
ncbi:hypothetical protein [Bacteroides sp. 51]|uniref:hypothetical protein n=1 Tax=Bacteroides sp. 51 TaxID=2302938 RepID=UPI0013D7B658|nr:hypothetical protein [Bacteroides sp. 51]NDV82608.1 hypothetical protein [Bacteroides sp. 51]